MRLARRAAALSGGEVPAYAGTTGQRRGALTGRRGGVIDSYTCGRREAAAMALRKFYDEERKRVADNDDCP